MSRDSKLKWSVITAVIVVNIVLLTVLDLQVVTASLLWPLSMTTLLAVVGLYYRHRQEPNFVLCVNALLCLVLFSCSYTILMYCIATFNRPLIDDPLVRLDAWMGFSLPDVLAWSTAHPTIERILSLSYNTLLPQTALVTALGLVGDRKPLEVFLQRFMLSALLTAALFCIYPAAGPFEAFGFERTGAQDRYIAHFEGLRAGEMRTLSLNDAEGLITFPSFHATWAILLALACAHRRLLFTVVALLNTLVVISTLTTGWHYLADVIAGMLVALVAIGGCKLASGWIYAEQRAHAPAVSASR